MIAGIAKRRRIRIEVVQEWNQRFVRGAGVEILGGQTVAIWLSGRSVTTVATAVISRANRTAAGLRNRTQAGDTLCNFNADGAPPLAV